MRRAWGEHWKPSLISALLPAGVLLAILDDRTSAETLAGVVGTYVVSAALASFFFWLAGRGTLDAPRGRLAVVTAYLAFMQGLYIAFDSTEDGLDDWNLLIFIAGGTIFVIGITGFWRRWIFWRPYGDDSGAAIAVDTIGSLLMLTMTFSVVTGVLVAKGHVDTDPAVVADLFVRTEAYYLWHMWDAIPGFETPETLRTYETTNALGGGLLLLYNVLVIVPVLAALTSVFRGGSARTADEASLRHTGPAA